MSKQRHRSHQSGNTPSNEKQNSPGVVLVQFSVSQVAQFSMSLDTAGGMGPSNGQRSVKWIELLRGEGSQQLFGGGNLEEPTQNSGLAAGLSGL